MKKKRSKQVIAEYLERIHSGIFEIHHSQIEKFARDRNGIYALYSKKRLYYVGLASSLSGRINRHLKDRHKGKWDRFSMYLTAESTFLKEIESLILRIVDLKGNRVKGKLRNALDLRKELQRDLKHSYDTQLDFLLGRADRKRLALATGKVKNNQTPLIRYGLKSKVLRANYKGKTYRAKIDRNGWIIIKDKKFSSPSAAGSYVLGRACNGWTFWKAKDGKGNWIKIDAWR